MPQVQQFNSLDRIDESSGHSKLISRSRRSKINETFMSNPRPSRVIRPSVTSTSFDVDKKTRIMSIIQNIQHNLNSSNGNVKNLKDVIRDTEGQLYQQNLDRINEEEKESKKARFSQLAPLTSFGKHRLTITPNPQGRFSRVDQGMFSRADQGRFSRVDPGMFSRIQSMRRGTKRVSPRPSNGTIVELNLEDRKVIVKTPALEIPETKNGNYTTTFIIISLCT
jgi:hypothetical protein